jgi:lipopolysaccharide export system protein LptA
MRGRRVTRPAQAAALRNAPPPTGRAARRLAMLLVVAGLLPALPAARAQTESQVTLTRKGTTIVVTLKAQYADGGRFIGNNPNCQTGMRQTLLYGPDPGYVDTRVGNDTELRSNVAIVLTPDASSAPAASAPGAGGSGAAGSAPTGSSTTGSSTTQPPTTQPPTTGSGGASGSPNGTSGTGTGTGTGPAAGGSGSTEPSGGAAGSTAPGGGTASGTGETGAGGTGTGGPAAGEPATGNAAPGKGAPGTAAPASPSKPAPGEEQTLELYDGTVTINRPGCIESEQRSKQPSVTLVQGRTTVKGTRFFLDQGADTGTMDGPIQLERAARGDSPALSASADRMLFDTQSRLTTLLGNVRVTSEDRVTTADSLTLDEAAGVAVLAGKPARSTKGKNVLEGDRLRYYLNNNDVVVLGGVKGDLEVTIPSGP